VEFHAIAGRPDELEQTSAIEADIGKRIVVPVSDPTLNFIRAHASECCPLGSVICEILASSLFH
jgi:hypothetical protein